jgi:DNA-binding transcriptional ArsR family regulator
VVAYADAQLVALADATRRGIFELVAAHPRPVGELAAQLPISRPAVSQHLKVLKDAGLVRVRPEGTRRIYELDANGLEELRGYLDRFWRHALTNYRAAAERSSTKEDS